MRFAPLVLLVGLGCTSERPGLKVKVEPSPLVPTVLHASFDSSPGWGWVEYGRDGTFDQQTKPVYGNSHEAALLGLKANTEYTIRAVVDTASGRLLRSKPKTITTALPPREMAGFNLIGSVEPSAAMANGFVLTSFFDIDSSWVVILDGDGDPVWWVPGAEGLNVISARPALNGTDILYAEFDRDQNKDIGQVNRVALDGTGEVTRTRTLLGHHDFIEHADGTIGWIAFDNRVLNWDEDGDRDVAADVILEGPEGWTDGDAEPTEIFNFWDYKNPFQHCSHQDSDTFAEGGLEFNHSNSLLYDADSDHYFLLSKFTDTYLKIDRASGEVVWQLSGRGGEYKLPTGESTWGGVGEPRLFSHAHMSQLTDGGFTLFDNGYHHVDGQLSSAVEVQLDEENMVATEVFRYTHPEGLFVGLLGDVRKLENGNYLVTFTSSGLIQEVDPEGKVVWEGSTSLGAAVGRLRYLGDLYNL